MEPIWLSLKCALFSAVLNIPWGIGWGWLFARKRFKGKACLETLFYVPLVLPPVLTGYFLLVLFGRHAPLGRILYAVAGLRFVLDWKGVVLAAFVVSSPFMIQLAKEAFERVDGRLESAARTLGAGSWRVFRTVTLPLAWPGIAAGFFLAFARSVGEFGATVMFAGNIPGKTQTIPLAIYSRVYLGKEDTILPFIAAALLLAYGGLGASQYFKRFVHAM